MNWNIIDKVVLIVGSILVVSSLVLLGMGLFGPEVNEYEYSVKTEQVEQAQTVEESVDFDDLAQDEQDILFHAYKKSDHFLGGASVEVTTDSEMEAFDGWKIVRVKGVPLLVAINGPEVETRMSGEARDLMFIGIIGAFISAIVTMLTLDFIKEFKL